MSEQMINNSIEVPFSFEAKEWVVSKKKFRFPRKEKKRMKKEYLSEANLSLFKAGKNLLPIDANPNYDLVVILSKNGRKAKIKF